MSKSLKIGPWILLPVKKFAAFKLLGKIPMPYSLAWLLTRVRLMASVAPTTVIMVKVIRIFLFLGWNFEKSDQIITNGSEFIFRMLKMFLAGAGAGDSSAARGFSFASGRNG